MNTREMLLDESRRNYSDHTTGLLPVPSVMGGAVENLVQNFIDENERQGSARLTVYSIDNSQML